MYPPWRMNLHTATHKLEERSPYQQFPPKQFRKNHQILHVSANNTIQVRREENSTNNTPVFNDFPESYTETMNLPCRALQVRNGGGIRETLECLVANYKRMMLRMGLRDIRPSTSRLKRLEDEAKRMKKSG